MRLIERILEESNIRLAQEQVIGNRGVVGGVDGLATYMRGTIRKSSAQFWSGNTDLNRYAG